MKRGRENPVASLVGLVGRPYTASVYSNAGTDGHPARVVVRGTWCHLCVRAYLLYGNPGKDIADHMAIPSSL